MLDILNFILDIILMVSIILFIKKFKNINLSDQLVRNNKIVNSKIIIDNKEYDSLDQYNNDRIKEIEEENKERRQEAYDNPESKEKIVFHGGCLSCSSPSIYGLKRCFGCQYFNADWSKPNLKIENIESSQS